MSTEIATIKGSYHKAIDSNYKVTTDNANLHITRFWNGKEKGRCIQLTIRSEETSYIYLTEEQVKELVRVLKYSFNDNVYPSD